MSPRVAVTGMGLVTTLARGTRATVDAMVAGRMPTPSTAGLGSTLRDPPRSFRAEAPTGEALRAALGPLGVPLARSPLVRTSELALCALAEALDAAGFAAGFAPAMSAPHDEPARSTRPTTPEPERVGVCVGTTVGCAFDAEEYYRACLGGARPSPAPLAAYLANDLARVLARAAGAFGPTATVVNACASSADAIGLARRWLLAGECDVALCGGADALHRFPFLGFGVLKNGSSGPCRPFDLHRGGLNLGDGAGLLVLERESDAVARGAKLLGFVSGYATAADAHHLTAPHPEGLGLRLALDTALDDAGLERRAIGFVHAHGTGTSHNDRVEGRALADRFGPEVVAFSTKGYTGHTLGAAGALGAIFSLVHLQDGLLPGSAGFETPDPDCVVVPTSRPRSTDARAALSCSLAFGGTNSVLVLEHAEARREARP